MYGKPYKWFIGVLADGTYHFIIPPKAKEAHQFIGEHGGGVYTHAGYLVFASNKSWWQWLTKEYDQKYRMVNVGKRPPHIDVPNIECVFSQEALKWLEDNKDMLKEVGGKYYDFIPRH